MSSAASTPKKHNFFGNGAAYLLPALSLIFLVYFRPRWALRLSNPFDDSCYLDYLHRFVGEPHPGCYSTSHPPGVALLWIPLGWLAKALAGVTRISFDTWFLPLLGVFSYLNWALAAVLCHHALQQRARKLGTRLEPWTALLLFLNIPALEHAIRFTSGSHAGQILLASLLLFAVVRGHLGMAVLMVAWLTLTRQTDAASILLLGGAIVEREKTASVSRKFSPWLLLIPLVAIGGPFLYRLAFQSGHNGVLLTDVIRHFSVAGAARVLFQGSDGLVWIVPWFLLCQLLGWSQFKHLSWMARGGLAWMTVETLFLFAVTGSHVQFPMVENRYLIASFTGGFLVWLEVYRRFPDRQRILRAVTAAGALWTLVYSYTSHNLHVLGEGGAPASDHFALYPFLFFTRPLGLIALLGMSPVGFTLFSLFSTSPLLGHYAQYAKYALRGPELWVSALTSVAALVVFFRTRKNLTRSVPSGEAPASTEKAPPHN